METHTPTGDVLDDLLLKYRQKTGRTPGRAGVKKTMFLVITDGDPSKSLSRPTRVFVDIYHFDHPYQTADAPEDVIINAANFFQRNNFPIDQVL